ncbi:hypothetical protein PsorP6_011811 [Peronosclerospora sorghi]|uniref:Uncharacterized protein n=1 Tax=Peronosclerospora sorghi TaxID=230839 RepID=A0ACC0WJT8_9STRA|nr:hypothetical protein PsorP6_011811 [Peronosclerospora sorghi]
MLYVVQNNLQFMAVSNLDAPTFQVVNQLKILMTATFSVLMLKRTVLMSQWSSIVMLMIGVTLMFLPDPTAKSDQLAQRTSKELLAVVAACVSSGFAGVSKTTLWERNVQMCMLGLTLSGGGLVYNDFESIMTRGLFFGYLFVFDKMPSGQFVIGVILVNGSVYAYVKAPKWRKTHLDFTLHQNDSNETPHIA